MSMADPSDRKAWYFSKRQEAVRKDVECCFGVLKARVALLAQLSRCWNESNMREIWRAAIVIYNMIVSDGNDNGRSLDGPAVAIAAVSRSFAYAASRMNSPRFETPSRMTSSNKTW